MEIPVVSVAMQIFGIRETEPPLISALFSISAKTLYFAARETTIAANLVVPVFLPPFLPPLSSPPFLFGGP